MNRRGIITGIFAALGLRAQRVIKGSTFKPVRPVLFSLSELDNGERVFAVWVSGGHKEGLALTIYPQEIEGLDDWLARNCEKG